MPRHVLPALGCGEVFLLTSPLIGLSVNLSGLGLYWPQLTFKRELEWHDETVINPFVLCVIAASASACPNIAGHYMLRSEDGVVDYTVASEGL